MGTPTASYLEHNGEIFGSYDFVMRAIVGFGDCFAGELGCNGDGCPRFVQMRDGDVWFRIDAFGMGCDDALSGFAFLT